MAGRRCRVVWLLSFVVICVLNTSYAYISDAENKYLAYEGDVDTSEYLNFKPLVRLRREDAAKENEEKPTVTEKKPAVPTKSTKFAKSKPSLKKVLNEENPSVETPSSVTTVNNKSTTTTSTTTTSTTTTPTSPTTINPAPISVGAVTSPTVDKADAENSTGGAMPAEKVPEATTAASPSKEGTKSEDAETETSGKSEDEDVLEMETDSVGDLMPNVTGFQTQNTTVDHHRYYQSELVNSDGDAQQYWVNFDSLEPHKITVNDMLSDSHRRAATVTLKFDFPFYGHMLRNITIATGGFLFTGDFVHTWLAATQYIAPLMANFDTSVSKDACVKYADNGTSFTVLWDNVKLKDHQDAGTFTFQATLHHTGDITFIYKQIPVTVTSIGDDQHPVKVGLSDAYIVDRTIFYVRRKTIYEYHKIDMKNNLLIGNWTAILFKALPTCTSLTSCEACLSTKINFQLNLQCMWCNKIGRCSTGLDRNRQDWLHNGCENHSVQDFDKCAGLAPPPTQPPRTSQSGNASVDTFGPNASVEPYKQAPGTPVLDASEYKEGIVTDGEPDTLAHTSGRGDAEGESGVGGVVAVIFLVGLILGVGGWVAYAYLYPHSTSGQILIRYRPTTWSWRRGEARYTAAAIHSIHM